MSKAVARAIERLLPQNLPPTISKQRGNLYEILSRTASGGTGREVYQSRWSSKGIPECYWKVTRADFKLEGTRGKAWGKLYWKGKY
jgi:small subunit ribosomal protein S34